MTTKLHLNIGSKPACGRQLNNHREARAQLQDLVVLADSYEVFVSALTASRPQACRWCARTAGLLPPVTRRITFETKDEQDARLLDEMYADEESEE